MIKGFTCGAFDLLHAGHIKMLKEIKSQCDYLIVGLQTDPSIDRPQKHKPIETIEERLIRLKSCKYVDKIVVYDTELDLYNLLKEIYGDNNVFLNYPVDKIALDCMLNYKDNKIDIEYDGVFWHKNKKKKDAQRNYFLMTKGYKIIRILGNYEIPNKEQLKQTIDCLVKGKQKLIRINMDI